MFNKTNKKVLKNTSYLTEQSVVISVPHTRRPGYVSFLGVQMLWLEKHPTFFAIRFPKIKILEKYFVNLCTWESRDFSSFEKTFFLIASESMCEDCEYHGGESVIRDIAS